MKYLRAGLPLALVFASAAAQPDAEQGLLTCSAIREDTARLTCYDGLANDAAPPIVATGGNWYASTDTNPVDDSVMVFFATEATGDSTSSTYGDPYVLKLRCQSGLLDAWITWNEYLGLDTTQVTYRIGTSPAVTDTWYISTDNTGSFFLRTRPRLERLSIS